MKEKELDYYKLWEQLPVSMRKVIEKKDAQTSMGEIHILIVVFAALSVAFGSTIFWMIACDTNVTYHDDNGIAYGVFVFLAVVLYMVFGQIDISYQRLITRRTGYGYLIIDYVYNGYAFYNDSSVFVPIKKTMKQYMGSRPQSIPHVDFTSIISVVKMWKQQAGFSEVETHSYIKEEFTPVFVHLIGPQGAKWTN